MCPSNTLVITVISFLMFLAQSISPVARARKVKVGYISKVVLFFSMGIVNLRLTFSYVFSGF